MYEGIRENDFYKNIIFSTIVIPVLTEILVEIKNPEIREKYETKLWYKVLIKFIKNSGIAKIDFKSDEFLDYNAIEISQKLLDGTSLNVFEDIQKINNNLYKNEEIE